MIKTVKGTRDYNGSDYYKLKYLEELVENTFKIFNGEPLITPTFERRDLLTNKYGNEEKLIFDISNNNDDQYCIENNTNTNNEKEISSLRYDMTVPLVRHILMNNINKLKRYTIGKVYRREQISKKINRLREFHQADFDFVGEYDLNLPEIQIFKMINIFFDKLNIKSYTIKYNFVQILYYYIITVANVPQNLFKKVCSSLDKLHKMGKEYVVNELLHTINQEQIDIIFECMINKTQINNAKFIEEYESFLKLCNDFEIINLEFDPFLARGLDYYTGIIFEVNVKGVESSVSG